MQKEAKGVICKFYGYGIVDNFGVMATSISFREDFMADDLCESKQVMHNHPYRVVELFYKSEK